MSQVWAALVADAVLGTERRPYSAPAVEGPLAEVLAAAGDVLGAAAAVWAYEQAGQLPGADPAAASVEPAAPDERPLLPEGTLRSLAAIVAEPTLRALLGEWLGLAAADGRRLPPEWIPALLDLVPADRRPDLEATAGPRAAWLAARRPGPRAAWLAAQRPDRPPARNARPSAPPASSPPAPPPPSGPDLVAWLARVHLGEAVEVLTGLPAPWPAAVTDAVMAALGALVRSGDQSPPAVAVRDALPRFALSADPRRAGAVAAVAGDIERLPEERRPAARLFWGRAVTSLNALVHFRQAMQQEFQHR